MRLLLLPMRTHTRGHDCVMSLHPDVESKSADHEVDGKGRLVFVLGRDVLDVVFLQHEVEHVEVLFQSVRVS